MRNCWCPLMTYKDEKLSRANVHMMGKFVVLILISMCILELRSFRLRVVSPTVCLPTVRVDSPTSHMSVRLRVKTCVTTVYSSTLCAIALGS